MSDLYLCLCTTREERNTITPLITYRTRGRWCKTGYFRRCHAVPFADAEISARDEDTSSTCTKLCEQITQRECIFRRDTRLWSTVPHSDRLRDALLLEHVAEPLEVLVARAYQWLLGKEPHAIAAAPVVDGLGRERQGQGYWVSRFATVQNWP